MSSRRPWTMQMVWTLHCVTISLPCLNQPPCELRQSQAGQAEDLASHHQLLCQDQQPLLLQQPFLFLLEGSGPHNFVGLGVAHLETQLPQSASGRQRDLGDPRSVVRRAQQLLRAIKRSRQVREAPLAMYKNLPLPLALTLLEQQLAEEFLKNDAARP